jgi:3-oxoacyl-[acyl-carrier protein] reductase
MELGLKNRTALVTASSKGLGRATAIALASEGANVVICARGQEALASTADEIASAGGSVHAVIADVADPGSPATLVADCIEHFGSLDILVANAGGPPPGRALDVTEDQLQSALNANLIASVRLAKESLPHMRKAGWGRICFITSVTVRQPIPGLSLSNTARAGLWGWAKTAAQDLAAEGITVNLICPGLHATDRVKELGSDGPMGDPEDFGKVAAFLCSEPAGFISGTAIGVDGASVAGLL